MYLEKFIVKMELHNLISERTKREKRVQLQIYWFSTYYVGRSLYIDKFENKFKQ